MILILAYVKKTAKKILLVHIKMGITDGCIQGRLTTSHTQYHKVFSNIITIWNVSQTRIASHLLPWYVHKNYGIGEDIFVVKWNHIVRATFHMPSRNDKFLRLKITFGWQMWTTIDTLENTSCHTRWIKWIQDSRKRLRVPKKIVHVHHSLWLFA